MKKLVLKTKKQLHFIAKNENLFAKKKFEAIETSKLTQRDPNEKLFLGGLCLGSK